MCVYVHVYVHMYVWVGGVSMNIIKFNFVLVLYSMISRRLIVYWPSGITVLQASRGQWALSSDACVKVKQDCVSQYVLFLRSVLVRDGR